jgi:hypothetical protein
LPERSGTIGNPTGRVAPAHRSASDETRLLERRGL